MEDIKKQMHDLVAHVKDKAEEFRTLSNGVNERLGEEKEDRANFKKELDDILVKQKKIVSDMETTQATTHEDVIRGIEGGGLFSGKYRVSYTRAMQTSINAPEIKGTPDAGHLQILQDHQEAATFRFKCLAARYDTQTALRMLVKHHETKAWAYMLKRSGYIDDVNEVLDPTSETLLNAAAARGDTETRADEIHWPGNTAKGLDNLTFELLTPQLIDKVDLALVVANNVRNIPLTRSQQKFPKNLNDVKAVWGTGTTVNPPLSVFATGEPLVPTAAHFQQANVGNIAFDAEHVMAFLMFNDDMLEDSIIPWLPFMRETAAEAMARGVDSMVLLGDTTGALHGGSGIDIEMAMDGILKIIYGHDVTPFAGGTPALDAAGAVLSAELIRTMIKLTGKYGLSPDQNVVCVPNGAYYDLLKDVNMMTIDKFGPSATIRSGVVGKVWNRDVIISEFMFDGNSSAVTGRITGAVSVAATWNRNQFIRGTFLNMDVESTRWAPKLYTIVQADHRQDFQPVVAAPFAASGNPGAALLNVAA